ncbi:alpha/beta fold hydrolase [Chitinophaga horti]|uniref:Alpha/beta fold hydrolase n=1 Tax=Chitinophaga horti TaxID=2920382 RepID=A0ABY6J6Y3_9BACT|nr:alpha/beta fold hydrolase [Chitinophaga horti]UYQ95430.1 alpha/beta fold hydrolase [Chitinophaga horti]
MKTPLILLHGALGAAAQFEKLAKELSDYYEVHVPNLPGHGGTRMPDESFSIALFADALAGYIRTNDLEQPSIFGYSMGGYVAMYLARHFPNMPGNIITLGTKFHWDAPTAARELKMLDPGTIETKVPAFASALATLHAPNDWKEVVHNTALMLEEMGRHNPLSLDDYKDIKSPSLIMLGDRDKMVTLDETAAVYRQLPAAQMAVLPGTPHPIEQVEVELLSGMIGRV